MCAKFFSFTILAPQQHCWSSAVIPPDTDLSSAVSMSRNLLIISSEPAGWVLTGTVLLEIIFPDL